MRIPFFPVFLIIAVLSHAGLNARPEALLYPEEVFPELNPLLETALEHSPELEAQASLVAERRGQALSQSARTRSRIDFTSQLLGGYEVRYNPDTYNGVVERIEAQPRATLNARVWWQKPLFYWGNKERWQDIANYYVTASEHDYAQTTRQHLTSVRETYLHWVGAFHQREIAAEQIPLAERFVENQKELLKIGRTSRQEILELEARLQESRETLALYARDESFYRNQLKLMVGDEQLVEDLALESFPPVELLTIPEIETLRVELRQSEHDSPAVEREEAFAKADETYYEAVKREGRPTIDIVGGLVTDRVDSYNISDSAYRLSSYVGLQVQWNIFDGHRNEGERMAALARQRMREARIDMTEAQMRLEAERALANLELDVRQVQARSTRVEMLDRRLRLAENPDSAELIAPIDRLELRLDFLEAEARVVAAKISYLINMSRLAALYFVDPISGR